MMRNKLGMLSAFALLAATGDQPLYHPLSTIDTPPPKDPKYLERKRKAAEAKINAKNGLTEYFYGENSLWALNQKNADKKAIKKGWMIP